MVARDSPKVLVGVQIPGRLPKQKDCAMWTLVFIVLIGTKVDVNIVGNYKSMYECFNEREALSYEVGKGDGYFKLGSQAVCVYREDISV